MAFGCAQSASPLVYFMSDRVIVHSAYLLGRFFSLEMNSYSHVCLFFMVDYPRLLNISENGHLDFTRLRLMEKLKVPSGAN
jgi:hypothetical protein